MKKYQLGAIALAVLFSSSAMASHAKMAASSDCSSSTLCAMTTNPGNYFNGFSIGVRGLDAVPSETNLGMFSDSWQYTDGAGNITARSKPIKPAYKMTGQVNVGYNLPGTANDFNLAYLWLNSNTHAVNTAVGASSFGSVFFSNWIPLVPDSGFVSDAHLKYRLDQVDLTAGRSYSDASGHFQVHPFGGLRYARLKHNLVFMLGQVTSTYHGIGPMVGFDAHFDFGCGFGAAGRFDSSVLMGTVNSSSLLVFGGPANSFVSPGTNRTVATAAGELGLDYTYTMANQSNIKLEIGYQGSEYFNPFDLIRGDTGSNTGEHRIVGLETTNFSFSGPFAELSWHA